MSSRTINNSSTNTSQPTIQRNNIKLKTLEGNGMSRHHENKIINSILLTWYKLQHSSDVIFLLLLCVMDPFFLNFIFILLLIYINFSHFGVRCYLKMFKENCSNNVWLGVTKFLCKLKSFSFYFGLYVSTTSKKKKCLIFILHFRFWTLVPFC